MASDTLPSLGFFEKHADKIVFAEPDKCWLWAGATVENGYGQVRVGQKVRLAHRESFEAENGAGSADGLVIRHRCDVPPCVNPAHLETGTQADNMRDMVERGRRAKGGANGRAVLTEADVVMIRADYVRGCGTHGQPALARRFGVDQSTISDIIRRECWGHVA